MIFTSGTSVIPPRIWWLNWVQGNRHYLIYTEEVSVYFTKWKRERWIRISRWSRIILGKRWSRLNRLSRLSGLVSCLWWILWAGVRIIWERGWNVSYH